MGAMAGRKRGGTGGVADLTVEILRDIRRGLGEVRDEVKKTNERLDQTNERLGRLEQATVAGLRDLRARFDHLLDFSGDRYRAHE